MGSKTLTRFAHETMRWARQLSWPWMAFFLLLASSIGFYVGAVMPMRHGLLEAKQQTAALQQNANNLQLASESAARLAPAGQLAEFESYFPVENTAPDTLELIVKEATKNGLVPKQAEYRVNKTTPGAVLGYQLTLPLKGTYPQLVAFISDILPKVKNLSLDNIAFQRQKISETQPSSTLILTLYLRREQ